MAATAQSYRLLSDQAQATLLRARLVIYGASVTAQPSPDARLKNNQRKSNRMG
ncbi:hypothetical protein [Frigidibacter sp. MR17.24]|uniref:hypothetical protein n=1 Tax=Frigidibacter sp. MR17.24 TaxID=3127345 RepID=UPI003012A862